MSTTVAIVIIVTVAVLVAVLLFWKNMKDKKMINPDASDSVEEAMRDNERRKDKL